MPPETLINQIYEAAVVPDRWTTVLESLGRQFNTKGGLLFANSPEGTKWLGGGEVVAIMHDFLAEGWMAHNTRPQLAIERNHPGFLTDLDLLTEEETRTLPIYKDFLRPRGAFAAAGTFVPGLGDHKMILSVEGFDSHESARAAVPQLDELRPHLARAALVSSQFRLERIRGHVEALAAIGAAACVVDTRGRLQAANHRLEGELGVTLLDMNGRLQLSDAATDALLVRALADIRSGRSGGRSIALRATSSAPARIVHVLPVRGEAHELFLDSSAMLIVAEAHRQIRLEAGLLQSLFDLTPAESKLASRLCAGVNMQEIAQESGVSMNTLKTQLKSVFAKTGARRQIELARLLVSISTI